MTHRHSSAFLALLAALTGCSAAGPLTPTPDFAGATAATAAAVTAAAGSMTVSQSSVSGGSLAVQTRITDWAAAPSVGCGTTVINAKSGTGTPTDETITYALPACLYTGVRGADTLAITGTLELVFPDTTGLDYTSTATALKYAFTSASVTTSESRTGTRQVIATSAGATLADSITTILTGTSTPGAFVDTLAFSFKPATGTVLAANTPLPSGTLTASGGLSWTPTTAGAVAGSFTLSTITPLAYDAACATSASPFDSGEIHILIADGSLKTVGKITWANCAAPVVTIV